MAPARPARQTFTARVEAVSMGVPFYLVRVPAEVSAVFGKGHVHVVGMVNGAALRTSLTPVAGGQHKLLLNRQLRAAANISPGDRVKVVIERAAEPREEEPPEDLVLALRDAGMLEAFPRIARSTRNALLVWLEEAKTDATRDKRIASIVERAMAAHEKEVDRQVAVEARRNASGGAASASTRSGRPLVKKRARTDP